MLWGSDDSNHQAAAQFEEIETEEHGVHWVVNISTWEEGRTLVARFRTEKQAADAVRGLLTAHKNVIDTTALLQKKMLENTFEVVDV